MQPVVAKIHLNKWPVKKRIRVLEFAFLSMPQAAMNASPLDGHNVPPKEV